MPDLTLPPLSDEGFGAEPEKQYVVDKKVRKRRERWDSRNKKEHRKDRPKKQSIHNIRKPSLQSAVRLAKAKKNAGALVNKV